MALHTHVSAISREVNSHGGRAGYAPMSADDDQSMTSPDPVLWDHHTRDVTENAKRIVASSRTAPEAIRALRIDALKKRQDDSAKRILSTLLAQTGFYLPREMRERGDTAREAYFLEIAKAIRER